jgi:hypothetical protein
MKLEQKSGKGKYSGGIHVNAWNFVKGFKKALFIKKLPKHSNEPVEITVSARIPFIVLVPEFANEQKEPFKFVIQTDLLVGEMYFKKHVRNDNLSPMKVALEDKSGEFTFSTVTIRIISGEPKTTPLKAMICDEEGKICNEKAYLLALELISKFIKSYKETWRIFHQTRKVELGWEASPEDKKKYQNIISGTIHLKDWIPELTLINLSPWSDLTVVDLNGNSLLTHKYTDYRSNGIGIGTDLKSGELDYLQDICLKHAMPHSSEYFSFASRHYSRGEFEAYCIMAVTALEKNIFEQLRIKLKKQGKSEQQIQDTINSGKLRKDKVTPMTINVHKALDLIFDEPNWKNFKEYQLLNSVAYARRDEIIHGAVIRVSSLEAKKISTSINDFVKLLNSKV